MELEWLAPAGKTRFDLARALAKLAGGALRLSFKYHGHGLLPDGRPDCHLTPAAKVMVKGKWFASVVDDPTIVDDLASDSTELMRIARTDDVRLALWVERNCPGHFAPLQKTFAATEVEEGFVDPWGQPLTRWHHVPAERARVCEVVMRPLSREELAPTLRKVMKLASSLGFTVPAEAAIHAHFDAAPFQSTAVMRRLISKWSNERPRWLSRFQPNQRQAAHCERRHSRRERPHARADFENNIVLFELGGGVKHVEQVQVDQKVLTVFGLGLHPMLLEATG